MHTKVSNFFTSSPIFILFSFSNSDPNEIKRYPFVVLTCISLMTGAFLIVRLVKNLLVMQKTLVRFLDQRSAGEIY